MYKDLFEDFRDVKCNPFNNSSFNKAYKYKNKLYIKVLNSLTKKLNEVHKVNYSVRYWQIPLSLWLNYFITNTYVKWLQVKKIKDKKKIYTIYLDCQNLNFRNFSEISYGYTNRSEKYINYSNFIYSKIFREFRIKFAIRKFVIKNFYNNKKLLSFKNLLFSIFINIRNFFSIKKIFMINFCFDIDKIKVFLKRDVTFFYKKYNFKKSYVNINLRKMKLDFKQKNKFENFLSINLMKFIPMSFLEDYELIKKNNLKDINFNSLIFYSQDDCDYTKFFLSESILQKCKIAQYQHGGGYGHLKFFDEEMQEINLYDYFLTYGWDQKKSIINKKNKIIKFFPLNFKKKFLNPKNEKILIVLDSMGKEFISFRSIILDEDYNKVILRKLIKVLLSLDKEKLKLIDIRLPRVGYADVHKFLKYNIPNLNVIEANDSLFRNFNKYKMLIFTGIYTSVQEALYTNANMIIFDFEKKSRFRKSFIKTYDDLKKSNLLLSNQKKMELILNECLTRKQFFYNSEQIKTIKRYKKNYLNTYDYVLFNKFSQACLNS
jgi:putative transferase (TIGR04331 family)